MYYRLSNITDRRTIETELGIPFKYPNLYHPKPIVNGLEETSIPVVTMSESNIINYAIWGILPENYSEEWNLFQNVFNTLNLGEDALDSNLWYSQSLENRRCLIIASGFFTFYLHYGEMYPYYVYSKCGAPLCLGGIYNQLDDGFITCALIIVNSNPFIRRIQNLDRGMPLVVHPSFRKNWLDPNISREAIVKNICNPGYSELVAHPIDKDFYKGGSKGKNILAPADYKNIPSGC